MQRLSPTARCATCRALDAMRLHIYSGSITPSHACAHIVDVETCLDRKWKFARAIYFTVINMDWVPLQIAREIPQAAQNHESRREIEHLPIGEFLHRTAAYPYREVLTMSRFALRYPYFIIVCCLMICVVGVTCVARMPVDLFPRVKIPVVVVATFSPGMPAGRSKIILPDASERFFTPWQRDRAYRSKSMPGVSLIRCISSPAPDAPTRP